jgi:biopolymer transport protein ExbB/TolQ
MQSSVRDAIERACVRSTNATNRKLKRGVDSLALIAITAPAIGSLAMLDGTRHFVEEVGLGGCGDCAGGPSELFVLPAISLLIAAAATLFHGIVSARMECLRVEMRSATLQLMNDLVRPPTGV